MKKLKQEEEFKCLALGKNRNQDSETETYSRYYILRVTQPFEKSP